MTLQTKLIVVGLLMIATSLEVTGDALVRIGISRDVVAVKGIYFVAGAILLFGYGFTLNTAPLEFHKVVGIYIAILFVAWQIISFLIFRSLPTVPILIGGSLIVAGGLIVAFWTPVTA